MAIGIKAIAKKLSQVLGIGDNFNAQAVVCVEKTYAPFISNFRKVDVATGYTTVDTSVSKNDTVVNVVDGSKITVGHELAMWTATGVSFYTGKVLSKATNAITVDTPVDAAFAAGASVSSGAIDMAVNGSVTPQIFKIRQPDVPVLATGVEIVIHRIIIQIWTPAAANDLAKFGDLTALTKGCFLRYQNGLSSNIFNIKTNGDMQLLAYDTNVSTVAGQAQDGITTRLTFGGNSKIGTSILLKDGDSLEMWVQDNLSALDKFEIMAEGYIRATLT